MFYISLFIDDNLFILPFSPLLISALYFNLLVPLEFFEDTIAQLKCPIVATSSSGIFTKC